MGGQSVTLNSIPSEPNMRDVLNLLKKEIFLELNCHHIGTVQSFSSTAMTVKATINYTKTFFERNSQTGLYSPVQVNYPVIIDCPIVCLGGGKTNLTFPIAQGDECLVLFNDRDLDNWFTSGQVGPVASSRLHAFSDAICLVGLKSKPNLLTNYDTTRPVLRGGTAVLGVNPSSNKILATNVAPTGSSGSYTYSTTLNTLLQTLITDLTMLTTALSTLTVTGVTSGSGSSGVPANAAAIVAIGTSLTGLGTQIGALLE